MSDRQSGYFQLLKKEMELYGELAAIRAERNDFHDAKMRAWDECHERLVPTTQFKEIWDKAKPSGKEELLRKKEGELLFELRKIETLTEHFKFAGLDDTTNRA